MPSALITLVSWTDGNEPASLIADPAGDLFGTTPTGGADGGGSVFEITSADTGYASTPTTLISFDQIDPGVPGVSEIGPAVSIVNVAGDLLGTTGSGGTDDSGTVFEIAKTASGYAATPTTVVTFNGDNGSYPSGLIEDTGGDLFGTTEGGGTGNAGTVFEIVAGSSAPTTLVNFAFPGLYDPVGGLLIDSTGDLFGVAGIYTSGGTVSAGVFEVAKTASGYASTATILATFGGSDGFPNGDLLADAAGDFFGTTEYGGADADGTVFEIAKTASGYASTPTTLVSFDGSDGADPEAGLIMDAAGDLFGTTEDGGAYGAGTVFEIAKTATGYASTPTTLVAFNGADGDEPESDLIADAAGDLFGTTGSSATGEGTVFEVTNTGFQVATSSPPPPPTITSPPPSAVTLETLASLSASGTDPSGPLAGLIMDAAGDLFGTSSEGGAYGDGTVFEVANTPSGYANAPTILVSFDGGDGAAPSGDLIADASGDLFGTTAGGGIYGCGTVFEIAKTSSDYASTPTTLIDFDDSDGQGPSAALVSDAAGDLFGTTEGGGAYGYGTVFEIAKTAGGYASVPTVLVNFNDNYGGNGLGGNGSDPRGTLLIDAAGNLYGTTYAGGDDGEGTVFEIAKTASGYASTATTLANFDGSDGDDPAAGLIMDAAGDLFGTTAYGGSYDDGTVFEIAKTASGYASTPTVLASFDGSGTEPVGTLTIDAAGDLFGTTEGGGAYGYGTVFEIAKTATGYSTTLSTLFSFGSNNGAGPEGDLTADSAGDLFGTTFAGGADDGTVFELTGTGFQVAPAAPTITNVVNFNTDGSEGAEPYGGVIIDAAGSLFGTTEAGGANGAGTVFEIAKTASGYASTPTILVSFGPGTGLDPEAGLVMDSAADLFGTTSAGGVGEGTVFEIAETASGYASAPTTLVNFDGANGADPLAGLFVDATGDLFGTTSTGGADDGGTVFEIAKTTSGYASTPTALVSFDGGDGSDPTAGLIADAAGDFFGTTEYGGAGGDGTAFEIVKTASGFASTPTTLVSFNNSDGALPMAGLVMDGAGDLFGTTYAGGADGDGTVFEMAKIADGYASTPITLVSFDGSDGAEPIGGLIVDAAGNLFGTTYDGGANDEGTVFEVANTAQGYASTPTVFVALDGSTGNLPYARLTADADGNLFGTTIESGGAFSSLPGDGTVFELTGAGFQAPPSPPASPSPPPSGTAAVFWTDPQTGDTGFWSFADGGVAGFDDLGAGSTAYAALGVGDFDAGGNDEVLWEDKTTGDTGFWAVGAAGSVTGYDDLGSADTSYSIVGVGDFDGSGHDEVLWEDAATGDTGYWITSGGTVTGFNDLGQASTAYSVVGIGDFDASGHDEVLWEDAATGDAGYWLTNAQGQVTGFDDLGSADTAYSIVGVGDFDGSGHDEVLWEDQATGDTGYWTISAGVVTGFHDFGFADTAYSVIGVGDYDGSGHDEVLFENQATGDTGYWTTNAQGEVTGFHDLGDAATSYHVVSVAAAFFYGPP